MVENIIQMVLENASLYNTREVFRQKDHNGNSYYKISWQNLLSQSHKVSKALLALGSEPFDNIGIFSDNCAEWIYADMGIISTRAVTIPFYATSSKQQLKYIIDETGMKILFAGSAEQYEKALWLLENTDSLKKIIIFDSAIALNNDSCISLEDFLNIGSETHFDKELELRTQAIQPDDLVTIIYTSGTSGEPKGVMLTHSTFIYTFKIHDQRLDVRDTDISACFLPLSHVFERMWSYYMLYRGATNVFIGNPREIINQLPHIKPTLMCAVPRFFEKTYEGIQSEFSKWSSVKKKVFNWSVKIGHEHSGFLSKNQKPPFISGLKHSIADLLVLKKLRSIFGGNIRYMPCAGAAMSPTLLRFFHAAGVFVNYGYGATETSATVSCFKSEKYDLDSCGTTMPGIEVKIGDGDEILVRGDNVFKGYFNKPEETLKTLVDGWYHSGDQGYITSDGDLVMTDRLKDLIKTSSGKYVSPQKIELLVGQDLFIDQIIAIGDKRKFITALIVPSFLALRQEAEKMGIKTVNDTELLLKNEIIDYYTERIQRLQEDFANYEKIARFKLMPEPFTIQNGMLTNTLKVRRNMLINQYKDDIDNMYLTS